MADDQNKGGPSKKRTYTTMIGDEEVHSTQTAHTQGPVTSTSADNTSAGDDLVSDQGSQAAIVAEGEHEDDDVEGEAAADADAEGEDGAEEQNDGVESEDEEEEGEGIAGETIAQATNNAEPAPSGGQLATQWTPELRAMARREIRSVRRRIEREDRENREELAADQWGQMLFAHSAAVASREHDDAAGQEEADDETDDEADEQDT